MLTGETLGPYRILEKLGEGGMGQVYRARDTKLNRDVALKVLPDSFASDPERLARFTREAQTLASLNHPNIAHLHGLEESNGVRALVMELVEGEDLSQRIARGPIPVDEALPIAKQIAEALEAAHEQGIIHRDLKPANIKLRPDGTVKVLDFGLAAVAESARPRDANLTHSPTLTMRATQAGIILGTAAYMSPEQASGKPVDKRADIWSFGVVLWEMLAGHGLFGGETISHTLADVLRGPIDFTALEHTPRAIRELIARCLDRDVKTRLRDIGEARVQIQKYLSSPKDGIEVPEQPSARFATLTWTMAALVLVCAASLGLAAYTVWNRPAAVQPTAVRFAIPLPAGQEITTFPAITRDGRTVAYVTQQGSEGSQLYLRDLNAFEAHAVAGSSGAKQPFFSPDGKWVAFFAQGQLQKAEIAGGTPIKLAEAALPIGGTWNDDDTIIYTASLGSGLLRVPASGGTPETLTKPDGAAKGYAHVLPQALPGGRQALFTIWGQTQGSAVLSLDSGHWEMVLPQTGWAAGMFVSTGSSKGRILVVDQTAGIRAAPFDAAHPARTTADTSVLADVFFDVELEVRGWLAVSNTGTAVYATGSPAKTSLVWVDREGKAQAVGLDQGVYREASLSPDGTKAIVRQGLEVWIHDLQRGTRSRLTPVNTSNVLPLWSRDGTKIIFGSNRGGDWDIYSQPADGSQPAEVLLKRPYDQQPDSILADGTLLFRELHPKTGRDLWTLSPEGKTEPLRVTPFNEQEAQFSPTPDGASRRVAYSSDESGRFEVYVQSYPGGTNRIAVSAGGGSVPRWSRDGKELFYVTGDAVVAVATRPDGSFDAPRRLFDRSNYFINRNSYDVSPDGKRFLMIQRDPGSVPRQLNMILNWSDALRRDEPNQ